MRRALFLERVGSPYVFHRVVGQRSAGESALLRAVVDQSVFADVEVTGARPAAPVIGFTGGDIRLKKVQPGVGTLT